MVSFDEIQAKATKRRVPARVLVDQALLDEHAALEAALAEAAMADMRENRDPLFPALSEQLVDLEQRITAAEDVFAFEPIGTTAWLELMALHPPDDEQRRQRYDHDPRTFRPAAIEASCVDPPLTAENVAWLRDSLPVAEFEKLWYGCALANQGVDERPKSVLASAVRRLNGSSPGTPSSEGSLEDAS